MIQCGECNKKFENGTKLRAHFTRYHYLTKIVTWISDKKLLSLQQYENRLKRIKTCGHCAKEFLAYEISYKFCSRKCAHAKLDHSHSRSNNSKIKTSEKLKEYYFRHQIEKTCIQCNSIFMSGQPNAQCCSETCGRAFSKEKQKIKRLAEGWKPKPTGGFRERAGRGVMGYFSGIFCNSTYEAAYVHFCNQHSMNIERNLEGFPYIDENGKARKYYPDFLVNGKYVEIKGFMRKRDQYKFDRFPYPIEIIDSIKIKPMIIEMKRHFGVSEIKILLEPEKLITKICKYCNTEFIRHKNKNFYCSRSCSGKAVSNKKWHSLSDLN